MRRRLLTIVLAALLAPLAGCAAPRPAPPTAAPTEPQATATAPGPADAAAADAIYAGLPHSVTPEGYHVLGRADAPATIVMFSDALCTVCAYQVLEVEPKLVAELVATGRARIVYRHLAQLGEGSVRAALAMDCAGEQGKFWEMRRELYERQADLLAAGSLDGGLQFIAEDLGVKAPAFRACMADPARLAAVEADARDSLAGGVRQRPTFDVAGERLVGLHRADEFVRLIGG